MGPPTTMFNGEQLYQLTRRKLYLWSDRWSDITPGLGRWTSALYGAWFCMDASYLAYLPDGGLEPGRYLEGWAQLDLRLKQTYGLGREDKQPVPPWVRRWRRIRSDGDPVDRRVRIVLRDFLTDWILGHARRTKAAGSAGAACPADVEATETARSGVVDPVNPRTTGREAPDLAAGVKQFLELMGDSRADEVSGAFDRWLKLVRQVEVLVGAVSQLSADSDATGRLTAQGDRWLTHVVRLPWEDRLHAGKGSIPKVAFRRFFELWAGHDAACRRRIRALQRQVGDSSSVLTWDQCLVHILHNELHAEVEPPDPMTWRKRPGPRSTEQGTPVLDLKSCPLLDLVGHWARLGDNLEHRDSLIGWLGRLLLELGQARDLATEGRLSPKPYYNVPRDAAGLEATPSAGPPPTRVWRIEWLVTNDGRVAKSRLRVPSDRLRRAFPFRAVNGRQLAGQRVAASLLATLRLSRDAWAERVMSSHRLWHWFWEARRPERDPETLRPVRLLGWLEARLSGGAQAPPVIAHIPKRGRLYHNAWRLKDEADRAWSASRLFSTLMQAVILDDWPEPGDEEDVGAGPGLDALSASRFRPDDGAKQEYQDLPAAVRAQRLSLAELPRWRELAGATGGQVGSDDPGQAGAGSSPDLEALWTGSLLCQLERLVAAWWSEPSPALLLRRAIALERRLRRRAREEGRTVCVAPEVLDDLDSAGSGWTGGPDQAAPDLLSYWRRIPDTDESGEAALKEEIHDFLDWLMEGEGVYKIVPGSDAPGPLLETLADRLWASLPELDGDRALKCCLQRLLEELEPVDDFNLEAPCPEGASPDGDRGGEEHADLEWAGDAWMELRLEG